MRNFVLLLLFLLAVGLVIFSLGELETIALTLQRARPIYVLLGILIQLTWFLGLGRMYRSVFRLLGLDEATMSLSKMAAAANFVNVVAPSGGLGGVAIFISEARRRGHATGRVTAAAALFFVLDQAAFLCVLAAGLLVLFRRSGLNAGELSASLVLFVLATINASLLYVGYRSEQHLGRLLARLAGFINRLARPIIHREYLREARAHEFAREVSEGLAGLKDKPLGLLKPVLWGLLNKSLLMLVLLCAFLAFDVPFSAGTIIAGFAMVYLVVLISPTPSGIGVVEGLMPVALSSLRVDWSQAIIVTLVYRALTFWLPLGLGAVAVRSLHQEPATTGS